jgi:hypothetical protein
MRWGKLVLQLLVIAALTGDVSGNEQLSGNLDSNVPLFSLTEKAAFYAAEIRANLEKEGLDGVEFSRYHPNPASRVEFSTWLTGFKWYQEISKSIEKDESARSLIKANGVLNYEDFYLLIKDIVQYSIGGNGCCSELARWLTGALVSAHSKSKTPHPRVPADCKGIFAQSHAALTLYEEPYPYRMHIGICEETSQLWVFDGESGWHLPVRFERNRLCKSSKYSQFLICEAN